MDGDGQVEKDFIPETPRDRILAAALEIIEREGPAAATTRAISAAAGVNVAAINYYFRTKEALLDAAFSASWEHALVHIREFLSGDPWDARKGLRGLARFLLEGGYTHPAVTRATLTAPDGAPREPVIASIVAIEREIARKLAALGARYPEPVLLGRVSAFVASVVFPSLVPSFAPWLDGLPARTAYAGQAADDLLAACGIPGSQN
jgi:AcrR family transcriptional regulator